MHTKIVAIVQSHGGLNFQRQYHNVRAHDKEDKPHLKIASWKIQICASRQYSHCFHHDIFRCTWTFSLVLAVCFWRHIILAAYSDVVLLLIFVDVLTFLCNLFIVVWYNLGDLKTQGLVKKGTKNNIMMVSKLVSYRIPLQCQLR